MPVLLKIRVQRPAAEVPKAVFTMAVAMTIPSSGFEILPWNDKVFLKAHVAYVFRFSMCIIIPEECNL